MLGYPLVTLIAFALTVATTWLVPHVTCEDHFASQAVLNEVTWIELHERDNSISQHTAQYRLGPDARWMVLRRGASFNVSVHLKRDYDDQMHKFRLEFSLGPEPRLDKRTLIYVPIEHPRSPIAEHARPWSRWHCLAQTRSIADSQGRRLDLSVGVPANAPVGAWTFRISSKLNGTKTLRTYTASKTIVTLFNAWSPSDEVFLGREDARHEFLLNEIGKIYIGSYSRPSGRRWAYGQFHEALLPGVLLLLDQSRLDVSERSSVVKVSRAVSAMVNSHDDNGLLVGNWSGNYGQEAAPWQWTGSAAIFSRYLESGGRPVKFGQCWVFGGVLTSALRTLGIPARTISNFVSAHDRDFSLSVDEYYTERGDKLSEINGDSIWNFHVWSDAWMERSDLPPGYGGWQALDATPQETSMGKYQLGPASLAAVKEGRVGYAYDVGFVYSEVNADLVNWRYDPSSPFQWRRVNVQTNHVGRKIYTKMIGVLDDKTPYGVGDAENIVNQYKYPEGSDQERQAYRQATKASGLEPIYGSNG